MRRFAVGLVLGTLAVAEPSTGRVIGTEWKFSILELPPGMDRAALQQELDATKPSNLSYCFGSRKRKGRFLLTLRADGTVTARPAGKREDEALTDCVDRRIAKWKVTWPSPGKGAPVVKLRLEKVGIQAPGRSDRRPPRDFAREQSLRLVGAGLDRRDVVSVLEKEPAQFDDCIHFDDRPNRFAIALSLVLEEGYHDTLVTIRYPAGESDELACLKRVAQALRFLGLPKGVKSQTFELKLSYEWLGHLTEPKGRKGRGKSPSQPGLPPKSGPKTPTPESEVDRFDI